MVGVAVSLDQIARDREPFPASAAGALHRARREAAAARRGNASEPGRLVKAVRLAQRAGRRAAGDPDPLAPGRLEAAVAGEVAAGASSDSEGAACADPQDGSGERFCAACTSSAMSRARTSPDLTPRAAARSASVRSQHISKNGIMTTSTFSFATLSDWIGKELGTSCERRSESAFLQPV